MTTCSISRHRTSFIRKKDHDNRIQDEFFRCHLNQVYTDQNCISISYHFVLTSEFMLRMKLTMLAVASIDCIVNNTILVKFIVAHLHLHFVKFMLQPENHKS